MAFTRKMTAMLMSSVLLVCLGACGTVDDTEKHNNTGSGVSSNSHPSAYDVSKVAKDDTIAMLVPKSVSEDGVLTVGMETTYAPGEFIDEDGKTPIGYDVDLSYAIAKVMGLKPRIVSTPFDSIIPAIGSKYDVGISSFTITKEREAAVEFVTSFKAGAAYVVQKGNPKKIASDDLCGVKVGVQTGTMEEQETDKLSKACKDKGETPIDIQSFKLQTDAATALMTGKSDILYADSQVIGYAIKQTDGKLEQLGQESDVALQGIAIQKGDTQMVAATHKAMQKLIDNGVYAEILKHWGVQSGAIDNAEVNPQVQE